MNIAIITGASSGIGVEFFKEIQNEPLDEVWVIARREKSLTEICQKYAKIGYRVLPMDITNKESIEKLSKLLEAEEPCIKFLFNNAGFGVFGAVNTVDYVRQSQMIDLNVKSLTEITSITLKYMDRGSCIINTSSIASFVPNARMASYSASKSYVQSFSIALRHELKKRKINVTAVCPGPMATDFFNIAGVQKGASKKIDSLPMCDPHKTAKGAIKSAKRGRAVYTPRLFYKGCRLLAKVAPHRILMNLAKA
ncbi:MAG: SDR family NAD(P)-dependent oxidoreductase [Clostridia bacterium]|nr:SDR family NAD(P)-dependent oxidoreductase [Clostridia bacterium]